MSQIRLKRDDFHGEWNYSIPVQIAEKLTQLFADNP